MKRNKIIYKLLTIVFSVGCIYFYYRNVDFIALLNSILSIDLLSWLLILSTNIALILLSSYRWKIIASQYVSLDFGTSLKQSLGANTLDPILPFKMGAFIKSFIIYSSTKSKKDSLNIVALEKFADLFGAGVVCAIIFLISYTNSTLNNGFLLLFLGFISAFLFFSLTRFIPLKLQLFRKIDTSIKISAALISTVIWAVQTIQFYTFYLALNLSLQSIIAFCRALYVSFYAGFLPISFMGIGVREVTLSQILKDQLSIEVITTLSILIFIRMLIPPLIGSLFLNEYLDLYKKIKKKEFKDNIC